LRLSLRSYCRAGMDPRPFLGFGVRQFKPAPPSGLCKQSHWLPNG
jgi:hypothetical protein